jgi:hypothetical protein
MSSFLLALLPWIKPRVVFSRGAAFTNDTMNLPSYYEKSLLFVLKSSLVLHCMIKLRQTWYMIRMHWILSTDMHAFSSDVPGRPACSESKAPVSSNLLETITW